jgi:Spy/CpxP family protein refolding chaperone
MLTSKRKAHIIITTAFILGIAVGASGQYLLTSQPPARPASTINDVASELTQLLKLTDSQRLQVTQILGECQQQSQNLKNQTRPQFQAIRDNTRGKILAILSNEQQTLYNQWTRDLDA